MMIATTQGESRVVLVCPNRPLYWAVRIEPQQELWLSPLWHYRPSITGLMNRHGIDRDTAVDMYKMRD